MAPHKKVRDFIINVLAVFLLAVVRILPLGITAFLSRLLASLLFRFFSGQRRLARTNIEKIMSFSSPQALELTRRIFHQQVMTIFEFLLYPRIHEDNIDYFIDFSALDRLDALVAEKRGVVIVSAHLGNWELMGAGLALKGYPVNAVIREQNNKFADRLINRMRRRKGLKLIRKGMGVRRAFRILKEGGMVIMLSDQYGGESGAVVEFMGHRTSAPVGAAQMALRTGAAIIPIFLIREEFGTHRMVVGEEISLPQGRGGDEKQVITGLTQRVNDVLSELILKHPEQWLWMHERWR